MAYSVKSFEVALENERAEVAFGMRTAVADYIRSYFRKKIDGAEDAGVDRQTAMRRASLTYVGAAKGYRLPRAVPSALANWCGSMELASGRAGFPNAPSKTVGSFDRESISSLPGNVMIVKLGGITFTGLCDSGIPHDLVEVRVSITDNGYTCTLISGRSDSDTDEEEPVPSEPETEDA